jgi:hypothetical protein
VEVDGRKMKCWWMDVPLYVAAVGGLASGLILSAGGNTIGIAVIAVAGVFLMAARYSSSDYASSTDPDYDSESTLLKVLREI